ncbi:hypothetical protein TYRP_005526 [Tyrophagus putrescentiae]|nr:hypothetical protein TYRP_005526 [Tyrophagus putrescentiae]
MCSTDGRLAGSSGQHGSDRQTAALELTSGWLSPSPISRFDLRVNEHQHQLSCFSPNVSH